MKISIIVPVYNSEKYLYKCIQSVVSQNPVECEMILVDDGSTDKSLDMMNKAAEKYPYIRVMHQTNQGVSMARNTGLKAASGEWIYFLDSDDELEEHALDIMLYSERLPMDYLQLFKADSRNKETICKRNGRS